MTHKLHNEVIKLLNKKAIIYEPQDQSNTPVKIFIREFMPPSPLYNLVYPIEMKRNAVNS